MSKTKSMWTIVFVVFTIIVVINFSYHAGYAIGEAVANFKHG